MTNWLKGLTSPPQDGATKAPKKVLFYGNCQLQTAMTALSFSNSNIDMRYAGNSARVALHDPRRTEQLLAWCDVVVTQPIMNKDNPEHHTILRERFEGKIVFSPYIWIDGLYSLCAAPGMMKASQNTKRKTAGVIGEAYIFDSLASYGSSRTKSRFRNGEIDFEHHKRFRSSIAELQNRETFCDVRISDHILEHHASSLVMSTHNHPAPGTINVLADRIAKRIGVKFEPVSDKDYGKYAAITLADFGKVLSPYVVEDLELNFGYDVQWFTRGKELIAKCEKALGKSPDA